MITAVNWGTRTQFNQIPVSFWQGNWQWDSNSGVVITQNMTNAEATAFTKAILLYETFLAVDFVYAGDNVNARFNLMVYNDPQGNVNDLGSMGPPGNQFQGTGVFNRLGTGWHEQGGGGLNPGGQGFQTIIHELGHGLGLKHPHDNGPGLPNNTIYDGVTERFGDFGAFNQNMGVYTMMTYNQGWANGPAGTRPDTAGLYGRVGTPMAFDIFVLQQKYGPNTTFANGNNIYNLPTKNGVGTYWSCIWDTGGLDTMKYAGVKDVVINLNMASLQHALNGGGKLSYTKAVAGGFTIANGVWIENAVGGAGDDHITGNSKGNSLVGGLGNDTLISSAGSDTLTGGGGRDIMFSGVGVDTFRFGRTDSPAGVNADRIMDFDDSGSNDVIDLSGVSSAVLTYRGAAAFTGINQVRIVDIAGPDLLVEVNLSGSTTPEFAIRLVATTLGSMTKTDFIL